MAIRLKDVFEFIRNSYDDDGRLDMDDTRFKARLVVLGRVSTTTLHARG